MIFQTVEISRPSLPRVVSRDETSLQKLTMPKHPRDDTEDTYTASEAKRPRLFYDDHDDDPEIFLPDQDSQGNVLYEAQQVPSEDEVYVGGDADSDAETVVDAGETVKETVKDEETLEEEETEEVHAITGDSGLVNH